jgi:hypothetical protein
MSTKPRERLTFLAFSIGCAVVLAVAASVEPAAEGYGTHQALGLPPCPLMTFATTPCPVCGITTAFAHAVRGDLSSALAAQPFGLLVFAMTVLGVVGGLALAVRPTVGSSLWPVLSSRLFVGSMAALWGLSWVYKIVVLGRE